ncbi:MAG: hypothetical protein V4675_16960 [Verrucomicrobiota bacterium]
MASQLHRLLPGELQAFATASDQTLIPSMLPASFWHIYIKMDFLRQYEYAETKNDGKSFVRNVARAAKAIETVISGSDGIVVEVQGSVIHCILVDPNCNSSLLRSHCRAINNALHLVFPDSSRVEGWRMAADWGKTLLVRGRGIHNDNSYVSLGNAANAPAKHLFAQLSLGSESERKLKRFVCAWRLGGGGAWMYDVLNRQVDEDFKDKAPSKFLEIRNRDFGLKSVAAKAAQGYVHIQNRAAPLSPQGAPNSADGEDPVVYYGWVMRADIDGFTARVEQCFDNDMKMLQLGERFEKIMEEAAVFASKHSEMLVQLPWAGDNFTAVVVFEDKSKYEEAIQGKLIEFGLDFASALNAVVVEADLGGWAQTAAGCKIHGNSQGNVYVGAVEFEGRRFLIGAGGGIGRSTQAFTDMDPRPAHIVVFEDDYDYLYRPYQERLMDRTKKDGSLSTLFRKGHLPDLAKAREKIQNALNKAKEPVKTLITAGGSGSVLVSSREYGED